MATPSAIRSALIAVGREAFAADAVERLQHIDPDLSARRVVTARQIAVALMLAATLAVAAILARSLTLLALNIVGAVSFLP